MKQAYRSQRTPALLAGETGYDPIEARLRENIRAMIEALFEEELATLPRPLPLLSRRCGAEGASPRAP